MRWYTGNKKRIVEKAVKSVTHDGVTRTIKSFIAALEEVQALKPGDTVFNIYTDLETKVDHVEFRWAPIPGIKGKYIYHFLIITTDGYYLYDPPSDLNWYKEKFNRHQASQSDRVK